MWHMGGVWTMSITINPSDLNAGAVFEISGHEYSYSTETGGPLDSPDIADKFKIVAWNPVACAEYFRAVIVGFIEVFLGWAEGAKQQTNPDCIFGRVTGWLFKVEITKRGFLRAHGNIIQPFLQPDNVASLFATEEGKLSLGNFLESVMCQGVPPPFTCEAPRIIPSAIVQSSNIAAEVITSPPPTDYIESYQVPLNKPHKDLMAHTSRVAISVQSHKHTLTCQEKGHAGNDDDCRLTMPRPLVPKTLLDDQHLVVLVERSNERIVPYQPGF